MTLSSADTKGLSELLAKVQAASGPDLRLDGAIHAMFAPEDFDGDAAHYATYPDVNRADLRYLNGIARPYTASIDAALALVERVGPSGVADLTLTWEPNSPDKAWPAVTMTYYPSGVVVDGKSYHATIQGAPTPPLAILSALLDALCRIEGAKP